MNDEIKNKIEAEKSEVQPEKMVTIFLPKSKTDKDDVFVSVNDRSWLIQRGIRVEVPECVAEVLLHSEEMEAEAMAFEEANANG